MKVYQIVEWDKHFENYKSRERESCSFVCIPNKQHGLSFSKMMAEKDGTMIYGIWCLILGACSQQKKPRNGWLTSNGYETGTPWVPSDLAIKFRRPKEEIQRALDFISSEEIGWIKLHENQSSTPLVPAEYPNGTRLVLGIEEKEGRERIEEKRAFSEGFETFWELYPGASEKAVCQKLWRDLKMSKEMVEKVLSVLREHIKSKKWKDGFIVSSRKWLEGHCWEDKVKTNVSSIKYNLLPESEMPKYE